MGNPAESTAAVHVVARWEDCPPLGADALAVVFDVLRATTAMVAAAMSGVTAILPIGSVEEARRLAHREPELLLAGERENRRIPGFDYGNSPLEWSPRENVTGRRVVWTTTNGTRAVERAGGAGRLLVASFWNRTATARAIRGHEGPVWLVAAGTRGTFSLEDWLAAGAVAALLSAEHRDDQAAAAALAAERALPRLPDVIRSASHARALLAVDYGDDVSAAADVDRASLVLEAEAPGAAGNPRWFQSKLS